MSAEAQAAVVRHAGLQGYAIIVLAVVVGVGALRVAEGFIMPIVLALVTALALAPVVRAMPRRVPRPVSAALILTIIFSASGALIYSLADDAAIVVAGMPRVSRQLRQAVQAATDSQQGHMLSQLRRAMDEIERAASESTDPPPPPRGVTAVRVIEPPLDLRTVLWNGSWGLVGIGGQLVIVMFLTYFLLACSNTFKRKLVQLSGTTLSKRKLTVEAIDHMGDRVARSLLHLALTGILVGVATWLALMSLGVHYAGLFGIAAGLLNAVPYLGPTIVAIAATVSSLVQFGDAGMAALVGSVTIVITTVEGMWLTPVLFGHLARVNPVAVLVSALFWGWLWGGAGLLLSLPLLVIIKTVTESVDELSSLDALLAD